LRKGKTHVIVQALRNTTPRFPHITFNCSLFASTSGR